VSGLFSTAGPASVTGGTVSGTTPGASTAVAALVNPPPGLAQIAVGSLITGIVTGRDGRDIVQIKTDQGTVGLSTRLPLEPGNKLTLQVQVAGARLQVILLAIDGRPVGAAHAGALAERAPPSAMSAVRPVAGTATPPASGHAEDSAVTVSAQLGAAARGSGQAAPANGLTPGHTLFGRLAPSAEEAPGTAKTSPGPAQRLLLRIVSLEMPRPGLNLPRPALMAAHSPGDVTTMSATATGADTNGNPIVKTPLGLVTLAANARLPVGAVLLMELLDGEMPPEATTRPADDRYRVLGILSREWPTLNETLDALKLYDPGTARALVNRALPQTGPRLVIDLLAYVAGLRNGKPETWLGAAISKSLAEIGRPELAARLAEEFGQTARLAADQPTGDWRAFLIPLYHEGRLHQLRMFLRRDQRGDGDSGTEEDSARFVIEFDLSALGELQIDGLSRGKRLDLILRSRSPLPGDMRRDLTAIYARSCEATGLAGEIAFQTASVFAVTPLEDMSEEDDGLVV